MLTVELIYDRGCPNIQATREHLLRAFAQIGLPSQWQEWDRSVPETPTHVLNYGSPTILVNGHDVAGALPSGGVDGCRLYAGRDGQLSGIPSTESIASALLRANENPALDTSDPTLRRVGSAQAI